MCVRRPPYSWLKSLNGEVDNKSVIPMCSFIRFQNHEVVCFYRAALWIRNFMRPVVQKLTLPGRRSTFYPHPAPSPKDGWNPKRYIFVGFIWKVKSEGLIFSRHLWKICPKGLCFSPHLWKICPKSLFCVGAFDKFVRRVQILSPSWKKKIRGADEKWNVLGSWNKDVLCLSPIINWLIHWFVSFVHSFPRSFFHLFIYSFLRVFIYFSL